MYAVSHRPPRAAVTGARRTGPTRRPRLELHTRLGRARPAILRTRNNQHATEAKFNSEGGRLVRKKPNKGPQVLVLWLCGALCSKTIGITPE